MTRAIDDKTSTCGSCAYFSQDEPDGTLPHTGHCNWLSLPAWAYKYIKADQNNTLMYDTDGLNCWLHTKRSVNGSDKHP